MKWLERSGLDRNGKKPPLTLNAAGGAALLALGTVTAVAAMLIVANAPQLGAKVEPVAAQVAGVPAAAPPSPYVPAMSTPEPMPSESDLLLLSYAPHGG